MTVQAERAVVDIDAAMSLLVSARPQQNGWDVVTPLLYPSGAAVAVNVSHYRGGVGTRESFAISDIGLGFGEAFAMDIATGFSRCAKELGDEYGVVYDKRRLFIPEVSWDRVPAAVKLVANCSQGAVILASERAQERKAEERSEKLFYRLQRLFSDVTRKAELSGASETDWTVDALVKSGDRLIVFDAVTNHANSVSSTSTKFHDLALREDAPSRCATVENKRDLGTLLAVLSQAGRVIEDRAPDQTVRELAEVA